VKEKNYFLLIMVTCEFTKPVVKKEGLKINGIWGWDFKKKLIQELAPVI